MIKRKYNNGFTLLELMMVLAVVGIVLSIATPSLTRILDRNAVRKVSSDLSFSLLQARSEAVKRNQIVSVTPTNIGWEDGWQITSGGQTIASFDASERLNVVGPVQIVFEGNGRVSNLDNNDRFELEVNGSEVPLYCVYVSTTGKATVLIDQDDDGVCANG